MLRNLPVRARLLLVIAMPLVVLVLVALPELDERTQEAQVADRALSVTRETAAVMAAVDAIQGERLLASAARAGAVEEVEDLLGAQRALVDRLVAEAARALEAMAADPRLGDAARAARTGLDALGRIREETDAAASIVPWVDPFAAVLDPLLLAEEEAGSAVGASPEGDELVAAALVARSKEAASAQAAQVAAASVWGELRGDQATILSGLRADEVAFRTAYLATSGSGDRVDRRAEVQQGEATVAGRAVDEVIRRMSVSSVTPLSEWLDVARGRQEVLRRVETTRTEDATTAMGELGSQARRERLVYAGLVTGGLALAIGLAVLAARSITKPLRRLTDAADELAERRLPRLVEALRNPGQEDERYLAATIEPLDLDGNDELGRLSRAFNSVQSVAVSVAAEQAGLLRKGISDLYVNLARRNQSLIERQISLLDDLEAGEQDPDVLEHLFLLDHLATRMRRNAESLLVLAGAEAAQRRSRPIAVTDVVRAALSEVEDYERVDLGDLAAAVVQGHVVSDVAHILAELLENATHFSPPSTRVRVQGVRTGGSYQLMVSDDGIGMPDEQIEELNAMLEDPPVTGLALGRSLGSSWRPGWRPVTASPSACGRPPGSASRRTSCCPAASSWRGRPPWRPRPGPGSPGPRSLPAAASTPSHPVPARRRRRRPRRRGPLPPRCRRGCPRPCPAMPPSRPASSRC